MRLPSLCPLCGVLALDPGHPTNDRGVNCTCWDCGHCRVVAQLEQQPDLVANLIGGPYRCRPDGVDLRPGPRYRWAPLLAADI